MAGACLEQRCLNIFARNRNLSFIIRRPCLNLDMIDEIAAHCVETKENKLMLDHRRDRLMCKPFSCRVTYAWVCTILSVFFLFLPSAEITSTFFTLFMSFKEGSRFFEMITQIELKKTFYHCTWFKKVDKMVRKFFDT